MTLGTLDPLVITSETPTAIEVVLLSTLINGNYLLTVETNSGASGHDEFDLTIKRPRKGLQYRMVSDEEVVIGIDQTGTLASFTVERDGLATVMTSAEISG